MPKLPKWVPVSDCKKIFSLIKKAGGESRLVGGCVRDILLGKSHSDVDIATTVIPDVAMSVLKKAEIKVIPTGLKHGTVTAVLNEKHYEITTLRKDVETDGRHAVVEFTDSWKEDSRRRDFTINAMSMDLEGEVYDYFDGQKDLQSKLVKFVGNPEKRIEEDYLRILRYFRFISGCDYCENGFRLDANEDFLPENHFRFRRTDDRHTCGNADGHQGPRLRQRQYRWNYQRRSASEFAG